MPRSCRVKNRSQKKTTISPPPPPNTLYGMNLGSCYNTDEVESRQERKEVRARASLQALGRGESGCAMSPVDMARAMAGLLRMHQSELEMQVRPAFLRWFGLHHSSQCRVSFALLSMVRAFPPFLFSGCGIEKQGGFWGLDRLHKALQSRKRRESFVAFFSCDSELSCTRR